MVGFHATVREYLGFLNFDQIALVLYLLSFVLLLRAYPVKSKSAYLSPFFCIYFGLVFASLSGIFFNGSDSSYLTRDESTGILILKAFSVFWSGSKVLYGGYFGAIAGVLIFCLIWGLKKELLPKLLDISSISIALLFSVWRIGCFTGGCCYGVHSDKFGIHFAKYSSAYIHLMGTKFILPDGTATIPLIPTQLISVVANLSIFLILLFFFIKKIRYPYFFFFLHAFLYGTFRFIIEFFRMDPRQYLGNLTISQWIPLITMPFIAVYFYLNWKKIKESFRQNF